jgi:hypothetical protein
MDKKVRPFYYGICLKVLRDDAHFLIRANKRIVGVEFCAFRLQ